MTFAQYMGFNIEYMPFKKVKGRDTVDIVMMKAIGIV